MERIREKKPEWIKFTIPGGSVYTGLKKVVNDRKLHTVCVEARCPNMGECFSAGTATFLAMGNICTRNCRYCSVVKGIPEPIDTKEPERIADAVAVMELRHAVITSVTRDDLPDGGASIYTDIINNIRKKSPSCDIEVLVPDFGRVMQTSIDSIIFSGPDILNHNIEVTAPFFNLLRPAGDYHLSLALLARAAGSDIPAKSGLMIGFGENMTDIKNTIQDLCNAGCSMLTVGQYLKSSKAGYDVVKYYHPEEFLEIKEYALARGFKKVLSGPLIRSSYHALNQASAQ